MNLAVVGTRECREKELIFNVLSFLKEKYKIDRIVSGGARGVDEFAIRWARKNDVKYLVFKPDWDKYGKRAGITRNEKIVDTCTKLVAFWDGESRGTLHSINLAKHFDKLLMVVYYKTGEIEVE